MEKEVEEAVRRLGVLASEMLKITASTDGVPVGVSMAVMLKKAKILTEESERVLTLLVPGMTKSDILGVNKKARSVAVARRFMGHEKTLENFNIQSLENIFKEPACIQELKRIGFLQDNTSTDDNETLVEKILANKRLYKKLRALYREERSKNNKIKGGVVNEK